MFDPNAMALGPHCGVDGSEFETDLIVPAGIESRWDGILEKTLSKIEIDLAGRARTIE